MAKKKAEFMPEAAHHYATDVMGWKLPKKLKSAEQLKEIVSKLVEDMVKSIEPKERYGCEACDATVGEPDEFCWFCGADISDDGSGGFKPTGKNLFGDKKPETKKDGKSRY